MKKILITGANGFIGSHLIDYCFSKDYEICSRVSEQMITVAGIAILLNKFFN